MELENALPYREWLKKLLKERRWSYQKLSLVVGKTRGYWSQTARGKSSVPRNEILEKLAKAFGLSPFTIVEYKQRKAIEKLKKEPELLDVVLGYKKKPTDITVDNRLLSKKEQQIYISAGAVMVREHRKAYKS